MDTSEAGRLGAAVTNKILTTEQRKKAARKGWRNKKRNETLSNTSTKGGDGSPVTV